MSTPIAVGIVGLHIVDDNFLQPEPGTPARDHLASGLIPVVALAAIAMVYPRQRARLRAIKSRAGIPGKNRTCAPVWKRVLFRSTMPERAAAVHRGRPKANTTTDTSPPAPHLSPEAGTSHEAWNCPAATNWPSSRRARRSSTTSRRAEDIEPEAIDLTPRPARGVNRRRPRARASEGSPRPAAGASRRDIRRRRPGAPAPRRRQGPRRGRRPTRARRRRGAPVV